MGEHGPPAKRQQVLARQALRSRARRNDRKPRRHRRSRNFHERLGDTRDVLIGHGREQRQRQRAAIVGIGAGERDVAIAVAVIGLPVHRNVMDLTADPACPQPRHDLLAAHADRGEIDQHDIEMKHWIAAGHRRHGAHRGGERCEGRVVAGSKRAPARNEAVELGELAQTQCAENVGQAVIVARLVHLVVPGIDPALRAGGSRAVSERWSGSRVMP